MTSRDSCSLNEEIAGWASFYRHDALPGSVVDSTKLRVVDIVGCMLGAVSHPDVVKTRGVAAEAFPAAASRSSGAIKRWT